MYMRSANYPRNSDYSQSLLDFAQESLIKCLAEKGYSLINKICYPVCTTELKKINPESGRDQRINELHLTTVTTRLQE